MSASPAVEMYEQRFAEVVGAQHAVAFNQARSALVAILTAAGVGDGEGVALSPLTCEVVPLALIARGFHPLYLDVAPGTLNLDATALAAAPPVRAVVFQHTYGLSTGAEDVARVATGRRALVIEDCAQLMPYRSGDRSPGSTGDAAIFSLNLLKPLPAGSGGMAVTRDSALAGAIRAERDRLPARRHGSDVALAAEAFVQRTLLTPKTYWFALATHRALRGRRRDEPLSDGIRNRIVDSGTQISDYQARRGLQALERVAQLASVRAEQCAWYESALPDVPTVTPRPAGAPLYYYPVLSARKQDLLRRARAARLQVVAWPDRTPIYGVDDAALLTRYGYKADSCPAADAAAARLVGLPTGSDVTSRHLRAIADLVRSAA